jgi:hypothetical protein
LLGWIKESGRFNSLEKFHRVCASCEHCQWSREQEIGPVVPSATVDRPRE